MSVTYNIVPSGEKLALECVFFLTAGKSNPLTLAERLVYSLLVKFLRMGWTARKKQIAIACGLGNVSKSLAAVTTALESLKAKRLVVQVGKNYIALEPTAEHAAWFVRKASRKPLAHWGDAFAYSCCPIEHDATTSVLMGIVASYGGIMKSTSYSGLSEQTGVSRQTIGRTIDRLVDEGRLKVTIVSQSQFGTAKRIMLELIVTAPQEAQIPEAPKASEAPIVPEAPEANTSEAKCEPKPKAPEPTVEQFDNVETCIRRLQTNFHIPERFQKEAFHELNKFPLADQFDLAQRMLSHADEMFVKYKKAGTCNADHCGKFYVNALKEANAKRLEAEENVRRQLTANHTYFSFDADLE